MGIVRDQVSLSLGFGTTQELDAGQGLFELGFDSLTALELRNRLVEATGLRLPPGLVFDHPTPGMLAAHLLSHLEGS
ncbi:acyl carrier protein [Frankia sp. AgKG'84/4]|nr:acyl carrier protein [Frankia sp. AgKG'84/4]